MYEKVGGGGSIGVECSVGPTVKINKKLPVSINGYGLEYELDADAKIGLFPEVSLSMGAEGQWNAACQEGCIDARGELSLGISGGIDMKVNKSELELKFGKGPNGEIKDMDLIEVRGTKLSVLLDIGGISGSVGVGYGNNCDEPLQCSMSIGPGSFEVTISGGTIEFFDQKWATVSLSENVDFSYEHELWLEEEIGSCE